MHWHQLLMAESFLKVKCKHCLLNPWLSYIATLLYISIVSVSLKTALLKEEKNSATYKRLQLENAFSDLR